MLQPDHDASYGNLGCIAARRFVKAGRQTPELLEPGEGILYGMPASIANGIQGGRMLTAWVGWNDRFGPDGRHGLPYRIAIVGPVSKHKLGMPSIQQGLGGTALMGLSRREHKVQRVAVGIAEQMDFCRDAPAGSPESLVQEPPFWPAEC